MTRVPAFGPLAACLAAAIVLALPTPAAAQDAPVFRGTGDAVRVFVTVLDRDGRLVTDLEQGDFELEDEGDVQPITLFDNSPQPIRLIVLLDVSGSMEGNLRLLRAASDQLFARLLPDDAARVGSFGQDVTISPTFTGDRAELREALPESIPSDAPTPLWSALDQAMEAFAEEEGDERRVILLLSDGKDSGPLTRADFSRQVPSQAGVIDRAREEDVMIYAVGLRSRSNPRNRQPPGGFGQPGVGAGGLQRMLTADLPDPGLARVAEETGGGYTEIRTGEDLAAAFTEVADELHSQYLLGFAPPRRDGKKHDLDVKVDRRGLKPRARKSYEAPEE